MPKLTFTVGSTRSGKSTYVKEWEYEQRMKYSRAVVINEDKVRLAMHGQRYASRAEGLVQSMTIVFIRAMLNSGYDVLYDETNTSVNSLRAIFELDVDAKPIVFLETLDVLYQRARNTNQEDLINAGVIDRHCGQLYKLSYYRYIPDQKTEVRKREDPTIYLNRQLTESVIISSKGYKHTAHGVVKYPETYTVWSNADLYNQKLKENPNGFREEILKGIEEVRKEFK